MAAFKYIFFLNIFLNNCINISRTKSACHVLTLGVIVCRLTDTQFKLDALDKDPFALNSLARPMPFRGTYTHAHINH